MTNDPIELIFSNPSGAPLALQTQELGQVIDQLETLYDFALKQLADNVRANLLLFDAGRGSLRFKFQLKLEYLKVDLQYHTDPPQQDQRPALSIAEAPTQTKKDPLTLSAEVVGLVTAFLALSSASPAEMTAMRNDPVMKTMVPEDGVGDALKIIDGVRSSSARCGGEKVIYRVRDVEVELHSRGAELEPLLRNIELRSINDIIQPSTRWTGTLRDVRTMDAMAVYKGRRFRVMSARVTRRNSSDRVLLLVPVDQEGGASYLSEGSYLAIDADKVRVWGNETFAGYYSGVLVAAAR